MTPELRSKLKLTFLLLITAVPITWATLAFNNAIDRGLVESTSNKGTLILPPADISALGLRDTQNNPVFKSFEEVIAALPDDQDYEIQPWLMVYVNGGDCDDACESRLHYMQQLHIALGKNIQRVRRYYVNASGMPLSNEVATHFRQKYESMGIALADKDVLLSNMSEAGVALDLSTQTYILLVDPVGNVMMYYTDEQSAEDIMADLETLLKYSSLG